VLTANLEGSTHGREFFIRKAIGWALREHAKTDAVWVQEYVEAHADRLSGLSRREALKHVGT
jgi:3-methyladenine DNA glycosylase AlkD